MDKLKSLLVTFITLLKTSLRVGLSGLRALDTRIAKGADAILALSWGLFNWMIDRGLPLLIAWLALTSSSAQRHVEVLTTSINQLSQQLQVNLDSLQTEASSIAEWLSSIDTQIENISREDHR